MFVRVRKRLKFMSSAIVILFCTKRNDGIAGKFVSVDH